VTTFNHGESLASVRAKINDALVIVANLLGFSRVVVAGQSDVIATDSGSTLTLAAGSNISLTTNGSTNTVTIASTGGGGGSGSWGTITGTLSNQTDLQTALNGKATTAQGALADTALQPAAIGTTVQGYSVTLAATTASYTTAEQAKLAAIASGATANSSDVFLLSRSNHTGTQSVATITGLGSLATQSGTFSGTSSGTNTGDQTTIVGLSGTKAQFNTVVSDGDFQFVGDAPTAHTHTLSAGATDVTITAANLNTLDDGVDTTLHFHSSDRSRANHTGTQNVSTITGLGTLATQSGTFSGTSSGTNTGDQSAIVGITGTKAQFDTAVTDGNVQWVGDAPTAHTHLLSAVSDVTITAANLNTLDDSADTTLHFHSADRARAVHTGTQTASTISDFNTAVDARVVAGITGKQDTLVSGTNIKTINGTSVLGSGNIVVSGGAGATGGSSTLSFGSVPGTNISTIVVTGQSSIGSSAQVKVWFQGDASSDHNTYEHATILPLAVSLTAGDIVAGVGFTIYAATQLRITGNVVCHWEWSN
jgi:hypothetical protein